MINRDFPEDGVIVVGGGLAGLTTAACLARAGRPVRVFERSSAIGGRATTSGHGGHAFNLGPHALYQTGPGMDVLTNLGVRVSGGSPSTTGHAVVGDFLHVLPSSPWSLVQTRLFGRGAKTDLLRVFGTLRRQDPAAVREQSISVWLEDLTDRVEIRRLVEALVRLSTYTDAPDRISADVAVSQIQLAMRGVTYVDDGWQTLVDALRTVAVGAGAEIETGARVERVECEERVDSVRLADGRILRPRAVVLAVRPGEAARLVHGPPSATLSGWADAATPVYASCLDIGLESLPDPGVRFAIGIDEPMYFSVHSDVARLAPAGRVTMHVARYLADGDADRSSPSVEALETFLDIVQTGWRGVVKERRFLPRMVVTENRPDPARGGLAGRPGPVVPGTPGLFVAGDWVGAEGWMSDASRASAARAAELVLADAHAPTTRQLAGAYSL